MILKGEFMKINIKKISNYLMNIGIALSIFSFYVVYQTRKGLPPGVCPIEGHSNLLYLAIFISILGLVMSFITEKKK